MKKLINQQNKLQLLTTGILLTAMFCFLLFAIFKTNRSTVTVLVNPKSQVLAVQEYQVLANLIQGSRSLSFYERLLKNNADVRDVAEGKSPSERKLIWDNMLDIDRVDHSSVIQVSISSKNASDSEALVGKTVRNLFDTASMYYNIKDDLDLRIIDGPITYVYIEYWYLILPISILLGFALAIIIDKMVNKILSSQRQISDKIFAQFWKSADDKQSMNDQPQAEQTHEGNDRHYSESPEFDMPSETAPDEKPLEIFEIDHPQPTYFTKEKAEFYKAEKEVEHEKGKADLEGLETLNKIIEHDIYPNFPEMPVHPQSAASAPNNLPVADEDFQMASARKSQEEKIEAVKEIKQSKTEEPSEEELKKRLNQLLRGEM